jgi:hypothetical protein
MLTDKTERYNNNYRSRIMLKKSIAVNLSLLLLLLSSYPAMASEKTATPAGSPALSASMAQSASRFLELLVNNDEAFSLIIDRAYEKNSTPVPAQQFKQLLTDYLMDIIVDDDDTFIAPGCLPPYTVAAIKLLIFTPTQFVLFLDQLSLQDEEECALMYGSWTIMGICSALASWTQYRICAVENSETPDQDLLAKLQSDLLAMRAGATFFLLAGSAFSTECDDAWYLLDIFED